MALKLIEGAVSEINIYLQAHMAAKLDALDAEYADSITLDDPAAYYVGEKSLLSIPSFPAFFILGRRTQIERYNATFADAGHDIDIGVILMEQDPEALQKKLYRYMRASFELVIERFFASTADDFYTEQGAAITYSPVYTRGQNGPYLGDAILSARYGKQEDKS